jgi:hypothetical protein
MVDWNQPESTTWLSRWFERNDKDLDYVLGVVLNFCVYIVHGFKKIISALIF